MGDWLLDRLNQQLARARLIGDRAAVTMLTARIKAVKMSRLSELEKRWAWGDR